MQNGGGVVAVSAEQNSVKEKTPRGTIEFLWSRRIQFGAPAPVLLPGNQPAFADMGRTRNWIPNLIIHLRLLRTNASATC